MSLNPTNLQDVNFKKKVINIITFLGREKDFLLNFDSEIGEQRSPN